MKWIKTNYKGEKSIWYSSDVIEKIKNIALSTCKSCDECQTEFSKKDYCEIAEILKVTEEE